MDENSSDDSLNEQPFNDGDGQIQVGNIQESRAIAIGRGATAVYQGLSFEEVAQLVVKLKNEEQPVVWDGRVPYMGLTSFRERDAQFFFGRESLVDDLLARLQQSNFITIAGPSGSGKSSVARAGLFQALRNNGLPHSDRWLLADMQPKGNPIEQLAASIDRLVKRPGAGDYIREQCFNNPLSLHEQAETLLENDPRQRFVLLIDQFEETFTQTKDEAERAAFVELLTASVGVADGRLIILLALRSDFVSQCVSFPALRTLMSNQIQLVGAMEPHELTKAITLPALEVGAEIDHRLVKKIMDDMRGEPGALPLMSFALRDLFEVEKTKKGQPMDLTLSEYVSRGGIEEALERHANKVFNDFSEAQKKLAENIFSKLIEIGQGRVDTRRTATFAELVPSGVNETAVVEVVQQLAQENVRLVTTSAVEGETDLTEVSRIPATITISHERMIDAWPWLRRLVDENRELIGLVNQINEDAKAYEKGHDEGYLYSGGRLLQVEERLEAIRPNLSQSGELFIEASIVGRDKRLAEAEENRRKDEELRSQKRVGRIFRIATAVVGLLLVAAVVLALQANNNADLASAARATSDANAKIAIIRQEEAAAAQATSDVNAFLASTREAEANDARTISEANAAIASTSEAEAREAEAGALAAEAEIALLKNAIQASQLGEASRAELINNPELALLLATTGLGLNIQQDTQNRFYDAAFSPYRASFRGHTGPVNSATFSPDGTKLVTASSDGNGIVWDITGHEVAFLDHGSQVTTVYTANFNRDGTLIVTVNNDGSARVWDLTGNEIFSIVTPPGKITVADFSPDGSLIVTADDIGGLGLWNLSGELVATFAGHENYINDASFNPDGTLFVTASDDDTAKVWDLTGNLVASLEGHLDFVHSANFSPDGSLIVTGSWDSTAKVWDLSGNELASLEGHTYIIRSAVFSPDGTSILTASLDFKAKLWDLTGNELASIEGHSDWVYTANFSPDGNYILTASKDGSARLWDFEGNEIKTFLGHLDEVNSAVFGPAGTAADHYIVTASDDYRAILWDVDGNKLLTLTINEDVAVDEIPSWITSVSFSPDGALIITADNKGVIKLWDMAGDMVAEMIGHLTWVNIATFSPDGGLVLTASQDRTAKVWNLAGDLVASLDGHSDFVNSAVFSPDGLLIVTASNDGTARLWDLAGNELAVLEGHLGSINSAYFSPDGKYIVTASSDGTARVWDSNGAAVSVLEGHLNWVLFASFSPDSSRIVTTSDDTSAKIWDVDGNELASFDGHYEPIKGAAFSPDGNYIITRTDDGNAKIWDMTGNEIASLSGHVNGVSTAEFSSEGNLIVTTSYDGTIKLWDIMGNQVASIDSEAGSILSAGFGPNGMIVTGNSDGSAQVWTIYWSLASKIEAAQNRLGRGFTDNECRRFFADDLGSCPQSVAAVFALFEDN